MDPSMIAWMALSPLMNRAIDHCFGPRPNERMSLDLQQVSFDIQMAEIGERRFNWQKDHERQLERLHERLTTKFELENWPLTISPREYLADYSAEGRVPLKVIFSPPRSGPFARDEHEWESLLRQHLSRYGYGAGNAQHPVLFIGDAWKQSGVRAEAAMLKLHRELSLDPTLILDLEIAGPKAQL